MRSTNRVFARTPIFARLKRAKMGVSRFVQTCLFLIALPMVAQTAGGPQPAAPAPQPAVNNTIVIDPAHGGNDTGAQIGKDNEKDINQQFAAKLRSLLQARSFDVKLLRDGDATLTPDQRAGAANQMHAAACIVLHASATGEGVHVYTSSLHEVASLEAQVIVRWRRAQAPYIEQSLRLSDKLAEAFARAHITATSGHTFVAPLDSLQCPAVLVEVGPRGNTPASDAGYQQSVADAIAGTLLQWREEAKAVVKP